MFRNARRAALCRACPMARTADLVGDSCALLIVRDCLEKPRRYSELSESLKGISSRTLANKLKMLEKEKLLSRSRGAYTLTTRGRALRPIVSAMRRYGKKYL